MFSSDGESLSVVLVADSACCLVYLFYILKRIFNLDTNAFSEGALSIKNKEMIGLACSLVLRCDDCVKYHLGKCHELGVSKNEVEELFSIATLIGGTIVIPHLRRAVEYWDDLDKHHD